MGINGSFTLAAFLPLPQIFIPSYPLYKDSVRLTAGLDFCRREKSLAPTVTNLSVNRSLT